MSPAALSAWCATLATDFRTHELRETGRVPVGRDQYLIEYVLNALADPATVGADEVLEAIERQRVPGVAA